LLHERGLQDTETARGDREELRIARRVTRHREWIRPRRRDRHRKRGSDSHDDERCTQHREPHHPASTETHEGDLP
jgi:hypothetical protein